MRPHQFSHEQALGHRTNSLREIPDARVDDSQVVESFLRHQTEETFYALFEVYCGRVRRFFLLRGLDVHAAEDLSQEVFFKVYRKASELRDAKHFPGWLYAIARNVLVSYWRHQQSRVATAELEPLSPKLADGLVTEAEAIPQLRLSEWLQELEDGERDLVILRFVEGLSYEELAVALKVPIGTIKWRISQVRRKLSRIIGLYDGINVRGKAN